MDPYGILQTIAEIAIAIVGFSGVVAVLGHRGSGKWSDTEIVRLRTLVEPGIVVLFASFLPPVLHLALASEELAWRISNGVLASGQLANVVAFLVRSNRTTTTRFHHALVIVTFVAMGAHFLTAFGYISNFILVFILGLGLGMVVSTYNFLLLLFGVKGEKGAN
jgi:hypothetical protein